MLAPYTRPGANPFLVDIAADLGRPISLRLSDKSCVELPLSLDLDQAQARLQQLANSRKVCVCVCVWEGVTGKRRVAQTKQAGGRHWDHHRICLV